MKVIFLDIDGVLNGHEWIHLGRGPRIMPGPAQCLHLLLERSKAFVVITSTWRRWIHDGLMSCGAFSKVLLAAGIDANVIDALPAGPVADRGRQILDWVHRNRPEAYCVLDDRETPDMRVLPLVPTRPAHGLQPADVTKALHLLEAEDLRPGGARR